MAAGAAAGMRGDIEGEGAIIWRRRWEKEGCWCCPLVRMGEGGFWMVAIGWVAGGMQAAMLGLA